MKTKHLILTIIALVALNAAQWLYIRELRQLRAAEQAASDRLAHQCASWAAIPTR